MTVRDQLEAIAKELKQQDALIEPHVSDNDFAVEYGGMQKYQALIIRTWTRLGRLQRKSMSSGGTDNESAMALSFTSNAGRLKVPKLELQKFSGNSLEETPHEHDACFVPECSANGQGSSSNEWHTWDWTKLQVCHKDMEGALRLTRRACAGTPNSAIECADS